MSNELFPALPGLKLTPVRTPQFKTLVQTSASGIEARAGLQQQPLWRFKLEYEFLQAGQAGDGSATDLDTLVGFFIARMGQLDSFLFRLADATRNPADSTLSGKWSAIGDGVTSQFQVSNTYNGVKEAVYELATNAQALRDGTQYQNLLYQAADVAQAPWAVVGSLSGAPTVGSLQAPFTGLGGNGRSVSWPTVPNPAGWFSEVVQTVNVGASVHAQTWTFSVWVFSTTHDQLQLIVADSPFSEQSGSLLDVNGFARFSVTHTFATSTATSLQIILRRLNNPNAFTPTFFGCQLEQAATPSTYQATSGTPVGANKALWSSNMTNAVWVKDGSGVAGPTQPATGTAPAGQTGTSYAFGFPAFPPASSAYSDLYQQVAMVSPLSNRTFTFSVYIFANAADTMTLILGDVPFTEGVQQSVSIPQGYSRFAVTHSFTSANTTLQVVMRRTAGQTSTNFAIYAPQLEENPQAGAFPALTTFFQDNVPVNGLLTFAKAPPVGQQITMDADWYYRCVFDKDAFDFEGMWYQLYECKEIDLRQVRA